MAEHLPDPADLETALALEWDQRTAMLEPGILTFEMDELMQWVVAKPRRKTRRELTIEAARRKLARRGIEVTP